MLVGLKDPPSSPQGADICLGHCSKLCLQKTLLRALLRREGDTA